MAKVGEAMAIGTVSRAGNAIQAIGYWISAAKLCNNYSSHRQAAMAIKQIGPTGTSCWACTVSATEQWFCRFRFHFFLFVLGYVFFGGSVTPGHDDLGHSINTTRITH